jgi:hypothetical protein
MQPISVLATTIAFCITSLITAGYFLVRKLTRQLKATTHQLSYALAEHAEVGKKFLAAIDGLPTVANVAKLTKHPMTGGLRTEHSHIVTFKQE